jgi:hypothetical protein
LAIIGFTWGGWVTGSKATELVRQRVQTELVGALTPVFQQSVRCPGTVARTEEGRFVVGSRALRSDNDWAKFGKESNSRVGDICAVQLYKL